MWCASVRMPGAARYGSSSPQENVTAANPSPRPVREYLGKQFSYQKKPGAFTSYPPFTCDAIRPKACIVEELLTRCRKAAYYSPACEREAAKTAPCLQVLTDWGCGTAATAADCKSAPSGFIGSSPIIPTSQACIAQSVEHFVGNEEVTSSSLVAGSTLAV